MTIQTPPGVAAPRGYPPPRPFSEFRAEGLLWLFNATVMHPRGFSLVLHYTSDDGTLSEPDTEPTGWSIMGDGTEPWGFADTPMNTERFHAVEALFESLRAES